jgi:phosphoribosylformimino-5-aminoimidazole carboxamide ribotide isomerase
MHGLVIFVFFSGLMLDGLQIAGGINASNAISWIERGASKVVVTSYLFPDAKFSLKRLEELEILVGKDRLVVDVRYVFNISF